MKTESKEYWLYQWMKMMCGKMKYETLKGCRAPSGNTIHNGETCVGCPYWSKFCDYN